MAFIKDVLIHQKFLESLDEVNELLRENEINENAMIHSFLLAKGQFPEEEDARLWALDHGYEIEGVVDAGDQWGIVILDRSEFVEETLKQIEIRNGVAATVGLIKQFAVEGGVSDVFLSLRNEKSIKLNERLPHIIELAKVVNGHHAAYGPVEITTDILQSFVRNFDESVVGVDLMVDYDHEQRGAAGWIKSVFLSPDGSTLFGEVKWTPKGAACLSDREFRYFSPEFTLNYVHPHTGVSHGPTLLGGGLVNRPFLKMEAIVTFKEQTKNNSSEVEMETIALNEHNAIKADLEKQVSDLKLSEEKAKKLIEGQKDEITSLSERVKTLEEEKVVAERQAKHDKLFSEGKISAAQLSALNEGKDLYEVLELGENMNTTPGGKTGSQDDVKLSEADEQAIKAFGVSREDYIKYNNIK